MPPKRQRSFSSHRTRPLHPRHHNELYRDPTLVKPTKPIKSRACRFCKPYAQTCDCDLFEKLLKQAQESLQRPPRVVNKRHDLCNKSINPPLVAKIVREWGLHPGSSSPPASVFIDLGGGIGSVAFYIAFTTGLPCISVDISPTITEYAKELWANLKPLLEEHCPSRAPLSPVTIIQDDIRTYCSQHDNWLRSGARVWFSNMLMPLELTAFLAEKYQSAQVGASLCAMKPLYPHVRGVMKLRDPDAFEFFEHHDIMWDAGTVEWSPFATGTLTFHRCIKQKRENRRSKVSENG